jgi:hypothetical protein
LLGENKGLKGHRQREGKKVAQGEKERWYLKYTSLSLNAGERDIATPSFVQSTLQAAR